MNNDHIAEGEQGMNAEQTEQALNHAGLRKAKSNENGWLWTWIDENGERIIWWVTDEA